MASHEVKVKRRALALDELHRLSNLLADRLEIEVPNIRAAHRDPELQNIQRIEAVNELLAKVLESHGLESERKPEKEVYLDHMKKAELLEVAESRGVEVNKSATKADIIEALNA